MWRIFSCLVLISDACSNNTEISNYKTALDFHLVGNLIFLTSYCVTQPQNEIQITKPIYWNNNGSLFTRAILSPEKMIVQLLRVGLSYLQSIDRCDFQEFFFEERRIQFYAKQNRHKSTFEETYNRFLD